MISSGWRIQNVYRFDSEYNSSILNQIKCNYELEDNRTTFFNTVIFISCKKEITIPEVMNPRLALLQSSYATDSSGKSWGLYYWRSADGAKIALVSNRKCWV